MNEPAKIIDGLFVGDVKTAENIKFLKTNKITYLINCCSQENDSIFKQHGYNYLELNLKQKQSFEIPEKFVKRISDFIQEAFENLQGVYIFSSEGKSRCAFVSVLFLMDRFRWNILKVLEFINFKKPDVEFTASILRSLNEYEKVIKGDKISFVSSQWNQQYREGQFYNDEVLQTNTFINSYKDEEDKGIEQMKKQSFVHENRLSIQKKNHVKTKFHNRKVKWRDMKYKEVYEDERSPRRNLADQIPQNIGTVVNRTFHFQEPEQNLQCEGADDESSIISNNNQNIMMKEMTISKIRVISLSRTAPKRPLKNEQVNQSSSDTITVSPTGSISRGDSKSDDSYAQNVTLRQKNQFKIKVVQTQRVSDLKKGQNKLIDEDLCEDNNYFSNPITTNHKFQKLPTELLDQVSFNQSNLLKMLKDNSMKSSSDITQSSKSSKSSSSQSSSSYYSQNSRSIREKVKDRSPCKKDDRDSSQTSSSFLDRMSDSKTVNIDVYLRKKKKPQELSNQQSQSSCLNQNSSSQPDINVSTEKRYNPLLAMQSKENLGKITIRKFNQNLFETPMKTQLKNQSQQNTDKKQIRQMSLESKFRQNHRLIVERPTQETHLDKISHIKQQVEMNKTVYIQRRQEISGEKQRFKLLTVKRIDDQQNQKSLSRNTEIHSRMNRTINNHESKLSLEHLDNQMDNSSTQYFDNSQNSTTSGFFQRRANTPLRLQSDSNQSFNQINRKASQTPVKNNISDFNNYGNRTQEFNNIASRITQNQPNNRNKFNQSLMVNFYKNNQPIRTEQDVNNNQIINLQSNNKNNDILTLPETNQNSNFIKTLKIFSQNRLQNP
eukprot:403345956